jgi:hypothetical protein
MSLLKVMKVTSVDDREIQGISLDGMTVGSTQNYPEKPIAIPGDILAYQAGPKEFTFAGNLTTGLYRNHSNINTIKAFFLAPYSIFFGMVFWVVMPESIRLFFFVIPAIISAVSLLYGLSLRRRVKSYNKKAEKEFFSLQETHKDIIEKSIQNRKKLAEI